MKTSDIPKRPVLLYLETVPYPRSATWCSSFQTYDVAKAMPEGTPPKLVLSCMRNLIDRKLVDGCSCGCSGQFTITQKGRQALTEGTV